VAYLNDFVNKMERKLGRFAIKNLMRYIIVFYVLGFALQNFMPELYAYFTLNPYMILKGQVWRLITFIFDSPSSTNIFFFLITLYFYYMVGNTLENYIGTFRFNLFYFLGIIGTVGAAFIVYFITGLPYELTTYYVSLSMIVAFALILPDAQVYLMMLLPIKMKWLAYIYVFYFLMDFVNGNIAVRAAIIVAAINFAICYFVFMQKGSAKSAYRKHQYKKKSSSQQQPRGVKITRHKCAVCGRTEKDGDNLEFRFCSKCNGNYEYCQDHLFTHTHVE